MSVGTTMLLAASLGTGQAAIHAIGSSSTALTPRVDPSDVRPSLRRMAEAMGAIATRLRQAAAPSDLPYLIAQVVFDDDFSAMLRDAERLAEVVDVTDVPASSWDHLPRDLIELVDLVALSMELGGRIAREVGERGNAGTGPVAPLSSVDLEDAIYGDALPRGVQDMMYGWLASLACLAALLDERTLPEWLRSELIRRAVDGQRAHLRYSLAVAEQHLGLVLPPSMRRPDLPPFDLDEFLERDTAERNEIRRGIDIALASKS